MSPDEQDRLRTVEVKLATLEARVGFIQAVLAVIGGTALAAIVSAVMMLVVSPK